MEDNKREGAETGEENNYGANIDRDYIIEMVRRSRVISKKALLKYAELKNVSITGRKKDEIIQDLINAVGDVFFKDFTRILEYIDNIEVRVVMDLYGIPRDQVGSLLIELFLNSEKDELNKLIDISRMIFSRSKVEEFVLDEHVEFDELKKIIEETANNIKKQVKIKILGREEEPRINIKDHMHPHANKLFIKIEFEKGTKTVDEFKGPPPRKGPHVDIPKAPIYVEYDKEKRTVRIYGSMRHKFSKSFVNKLKDKLINLKKTVKIFKINRKKFVEFCFVD